MTSFFNVSALGGNPFSTPVGHKIEEATDSSQVSENWALNIEICDMINESSDGPRDAMKAIRKRLTQNSKSHKVIIYTLTVLETCVKNCSKPFHLLVAQKEFIQELIKLIGPKNDPPLVVQEKVLNLIQIWADAFRSQSDLQGVVQMYSELKNKGIEFPVADLDAMAPIYTPQRSVPEPQLPTVTGMPPTSPQHHQQLSQQQQQQLQQQQHQLLQQQQLPQQLSSPGIGGGSGLVIAGMGPIVTTPEQIQKLQSELDIVSMNMQIMADMLTQLKPGQEDPSDYRLLTDLTHTCKDMQTRIVDLIGRIQHDEITAELLRLNDELNNLFLRHQRYEKNRDPKNATAAAAAAAAASGGNLVASPTAILGAAMGVPPALSSTTSSFVSSGQQQHHSTIETNPKDSLIDLSDNDGGKNADLLSHLSGLNLGTTSSQLSQINSVSALSGSNGAGAGATGGSGKDVDEFDMLAQSRNTTVGGVGGGVGAVGSGNGTGLPRKDGAGGGGNLNSNESEFDEMAAWLDKEVDEDGGPEESLTSKEFDRFLAERAAAAENLPTITPTTNNQQNTGGSPRKSKKDEESLLAL